MISFKQKLFYIVTEMKQKGENHFARKRLRRCEELERIEIENAAIARGVYKELEVVLQVVLHYHQLV